MLRLPNAAASVAPEMQPKLHFQRTPHPPWRISHAVCSFLKCSLSCISYVHRIRVSGFLMRCASCSYSLITVTSSYRICTCFPFHRSQLHIACHKSDSNACLLRHLYATYSVLQCDALCIHLAYYITTCNIIQQIFIRRFTDTFTKAVQKAAKYSAAACLQMRYHLCFPHTPPLKPQTSLSHPLLFFRCTESCTCIQNPQNSNTCS